MTPTLNDLQHTTEIQTILQKVDTAQLARDLGQPLPPSQVDQAVNRLRIAAILALTEAIGTEAVKQLIEDATLNRIDQSDALNQRYSLYRKWSGYIEMLLDSTQSATVDDLLLFATAGFLAEKPTDVRHLLERDKVQARLTQALNEASQLPWPQQIRTQISLALLFVVRQETRQDITQAGQVIQALVEAQPQLEAIWLEERNNPQRDAFALLGLYHLTQAVERLAEFLLSGAVQMEGRLERDFAPVLSRLLTRAEQYINLSNDLETRLWLNACTVLLASLQGDSIWVKGLGFSQRIDALLTELTQIGRQNPIFSLLPSQQAALRQNLLDPTQIAVVLQMPTSTGKTLLAEFAILQAFETYQQVRVVYLTPTRALATQVRRTLREDLHPLNIQVSPAGSAFEEDPYEMHLLELNEGVIVTTPEKLDLLLRAHPDWFRTLRLVVVDEAHLLRDAERGVQLEMLLTNIRRQYTETRLLLLTPFIQNAQEIATWLGGERGLPISVNWRPARLLLGLAHIGGRGAKRALTVQWSDPHFPQQTPTDLALPTTIPAKAIQSTLDRVVFLARKFKSLGSVLALFSGSRARAEQATLKLAEGRPAWSSDQQTPALRVAIALSQYNYGRQSSLPFCLARGVAYHHSMLSPTLRYLVEDQVRSGVIDFVAATTTLAQGLNFPVATVLVHSVSKPYQKGNLTPSEFWNVAGRAGRVGLSDKGLVIFANPKHKDVWQTYAHHLNEGVQSALRHILADLPADMSSVDLYWAYPEIRPFLQYLAHTAATTTPAQTKTNLDDLLTASLAIWQLESEQDKEKLHHIANQYLTEIETQSAGYLRVADTTGLASFSFDQLFANVGADPILRRGPEIILKRKAKGLGQLIDALAGLPELDLALNRQGGKLSRVALAKMTQGWLEGKPIHLLARLMPGQDQHRKIRDTATLLYGPISRTLSWGAHAYLRSWFMYRPNQAHQLPPTAAMLPAYIAYGVNTPEAALACLLGVPRPFAQPFADIYREQYDPLTPPKSAYFKQFVEEADLTRWTQVIAYSDLANTLNPADMHLVWQQMQGRL